MSWAEENKGNKTTPILFASISDAKPYIKTLMQEGDVLLFKGSRRMNLDILVQELL